MSALDSKYHIKIDGYGFMINMMPKAGRHAYGREEAPHFVSKMSSGDPNYRDSSFFPHWVQNNWLNGFDQEKWNDGGRFYLSSKVDTTEQEVLKLQKSFPSAGQSIAGKKTLCFGAWRGTTTAIAFDAYASSGAAGTSLTWAHTCSGNNRILFVGIGTEQGTPTGDVVTSVTYAGVAMTLVDKQANVNTTLNYYSYLYYLIAPATGTNNVVVSTSQSVNIRGGSTSYTGALQTSQPDATAKATSTTTDLTVTPTVVTNNSWIVSVGHGYGVTPAAGTGLTSRTTTVNLIMADSAAALSAGANSIHFTYGSSQALSGIAASFKPVTSSSSTFALYSGVSNGKIYLWDNATTWSEAFDTRRLAWFETGTDTGFFVGDDGGTEKACAQGFQVVAAQKMKGVSVYLKKNAGTPGDITVRIETNSTDKPSGTLVDAAATGTITAFTTATDAWYTVEFSTNFSLSAATTYWIVLKTAAAANDQNYKWEGKTASGYSSGTNATSTDGGSTWSAGTSDAYFRVLGNETSVNCSIVTTISGTRKMYFGTGSPTSSDAGDARLYSYDGTTWALNYSFASTSEVAIMSLAEFGLTPKLYVGLGAIAKIYSTSDATTYTLSKTITIPNNPGYVLSMKEYGGRLYVGGGFPELLYDNTHQYFGFLYSYDEYSWNNVSPFEHTVITSLWVFDNLLFIGTIKKYLYVYNTASMDKLFEFPWDVQISSMTSWNDKLAISIAPTPENSETGFEGIYLFDRSGFHNAFNVANSSWHGLVIFDNNLFAGDDDGYVYKTSLGTYQASGTLQTSYFEASLPSIEKHWRGIALHTEALPTGCSVLVQYKTDESDASWTTLGTYDTVDATYEEFLFPDTIYSKKISFLLTLATSVTADTPEIKVMDVRYVLSPSFKYLWKIKLACPDNIVWLDGTEPISTATAAISSGQTTLTLTDGDGFPTKGRAVVVDGSTEDEFTWTGKTGDQLTGVTGLSTHSDSGLTVKITGAMLHKQLLTMKQAREYYTFTDIDGLTYEVLFHQFQDDEFIINQDDGIENVVPITLLET